MAAKPIPSINLCPINFNGFNEINKITDNLETTLLFSKLKFHQINSKIQKAGKTWIIRSREQISAWFGFSTKKTDNLLSSLVDLGLIERKVGLWYGKKRLFINTSTEINHVPVNQQLLAILIEGTGSVRAALVFARIAYSFANTKIQHDNKKWCCLKKQDLADWSGLSIRTIDSILEVLLKKGLILKKNFVWREKLQTHFHIPDFAVAALQDRFQKSREGVAAPCVQDGKETSTQNCRQQPAKKGVSIRIRTKSKKTSNNTRAAHLPTALAAQSSDIIFNTIGNQLSNRQIHYLDGALKNTVARKQLSLSSPKELWEQLKFSIVNDQQHKGIESFRHAVSRCMKIIADGNWCTPIGFHNHSAYGVQIKNDSDKRLKQWEKQKSEECEHSHLRCNRISLNNSKMSASSITEKAMRFAKRIVALTQQAKETGESGVAKSLDFLIDQVHALINQGADRAQIVGFLKNNDN